MKKIYVNFNKVFPVIGSLSGIVIVGSLLLFFIKGLNYGVDFRGGAEVQVKFNNSLDLKKFRNDLENEGFKNASVQSIGEAKDNEFLIRIQASDNNLNEVIQSLTQALEKNYHDLGATIRKTDIVGPKAGKALRNAGMQALMWAMLAIMIYVGLRFDFRFAPGAIISLVHDALAIVGVFALTQKEFTLQTVAALLTIIGYSVNDTVVIYDRIREHEAKSNEPLNIIVDRAVNETLSRTIFTSLCTFFVSLSLYLYGGKSIEDFFFAITVGIIFGAFSTLSVAAPMTLVVDKYFSKKNK